MKNKILIVGISIFVYGACKPDPEPEPPAADYRSGTFLVNEGIYGQTSGTVTWRSSGGDTVLQDVFRLVNGRDLGNVLQSMRLDGERAFLVVNNSHTVEVVHRSDFGSLAQISGLAQPRYLLPLSDSTAVVSQWGMDGLTGGLTLVNTRQYAVQSTAACRPGPEQMLLYGQGLWVACSGGYGVDSVVQAIDPTNLQVQQTVPVGYAPVGLRLGGDGKLWVLCAGHTVYTNYPQWDTVQSKPAALVALNADGSQHARIDLPKGSPAMRLCADDQGRLYFLQNQRLLRYTPPNQNLDTLIQGDFYGLGIAGDRIYAARNAYINRAWVLVLDTEGNVLDSLQAGLFCNGLAE